MNGRSTFFLLVISICSSRTELHSSGPPLETLKQWNLISYNFPWNYPTANTDFYNPENIVVTGIAIDIDRIFIATPRLFSGVSSTLSIVPRESHGDSPVLQAYPDWSFHAAGTREYNCSDLGLVSVYRMQIDSCNRLWALDAGVSRSLEDYEITCPPKILVFDLNTDQVVRRIDFPREVLRGESLFTNMVIDDTSSAPEQHCDDVFVYITDTVEPAIIVYDSGRDLTWRLSHPAMYPDPNFAQSNILGDKFTLMDGVVGLAFDENIQTVYFQPLATDRMFSVTSTALRAGPLPFGVELPVRLVGKKSSQGLPLAISSDGSIFFTPFSETAIAQWNPKTNEQKVLAFDTEQLQFVADLKVPKSDSGSLYLISSKFQKYFLRNLDPNDINIRIMRIEGAARNQILSEIQHTSNYVTRGSYYETVTQTSNTILKPVSYAENYFSSVRQPYRYESVGIIDKSINNPFTSLNTGERPEAFSKPYPRSNYISKVNTNFNDFNGIRLA